MKKSEIKVGGLYRAKVSGKLTTVRVTGITDHSNWKGRQTTSYGVVNLTTGRSATFRSAAKFRYLVHEEQQKSAGLSTGPLGGLTTEPTRDSLHREGL